MRDGEPHQDAEVSAGHDAGVRVRRPAPDRPSQASRPNPPGKPGAHELVGGLLRGRQGPSSTFPVLPASRGEKAETAVARPSPWYRRRTDCIVQWRPRRPRAGTMGRWARSWTHRRTRSLGWGPKGRRFKSDRPDWRAEGSPLLIPASGGCGTRSPGGRTRSSGSGRRHAPAGRAAGKRGNSSETTMTTGGRPDASTESDELSSASS
jgi:hypothetical protein